MEAAKLGFFCSVVFHWWWLRRMRRVLICMIFKMQSIYRKRSFVTFGGEGFLWVLVFRLLLKRWLSFIWVSGL